MQSTRTHAPLLATLAALGLAAAHPAQAQTYTYTGTTVGGPTFNRPLANGTSTPNALSSVGTAVSYSVFTFTVTAAGSYTFLSTAATATPVYDNYTVLYGGTFTPTAPLTNVLIANDDNPSIGLSGFTFTLNTATSYRFVTTSFANGNSGTFTNTISGPGAVIAAAPEPSQTAALGLGVLGLAGLVLKVRTRRADAA